MSVSVPLPEDLEQFLRQQSVRLGVPVETLLSRTIEERWGLASRTSSLSLRETELLLMLQTLLPAQQTQKYQALIQQSENGTISPSERERLLILIEQRDLQNAERLKILGELATLRGVSIREIMAQLGIAPQ